MGGIRVEVRITPGDPLWPLLAGIPGRQRNALVRSMLEAALLPGGWARIVDGRLTVNVPATEPPTERPAAAAAGPPDPAPEAASAVAGMSPAGAQSVLESLRAFGALDA